MLDILVRENTLPVDKAPHSATLDRQLRHRGASRRQLQVLGEKRTCKLSFAAFGDLWVGDYHHGPKVLCPDGRVTVAKLGAFIDHTTRYPVADRWYTSEDLSTLRDTLLRALLRFGTTPSQSHRFLCHDRRGLPQKTAHLRAGCPRRPPRQGALMTRYDPEFPLLPYDLSRAPELAPLALLEETLHISVLSLCAEHPTLQHDPEPQEPTSLRRARRLIASISTFQNALDKYRDSVYRALCPTPPEPLGACWSNPVKRDRHRSAVVI